MESNQIDSGSIEPVSSNQAHLTKIMKLKENIYSLISLNSFLLSIKIYLIYPNKIINNNERNRVS